jgi:glutamate racemase
LQEQIDTLVFGCTHYPYLTPVLQRILPSTVRLVDPAAHVVSAAAQELDILGLRHQWHPQPTRFYVSGNPESFIQPGSQWLGFTPLAEQVVLPQRVYQTVGYEVGEIAS